MSSRNPAVSRQTDPPTEVHHGPAAADLQSIQEQVAARRFEEALGHLEVVLEADRNNVDALYMQAVCRRYLRQFRQALDSLQRLKLLAPDHGRAHQEEGHTFRAMGQHDDALLAYSRACRLNPALQASWREQLRILSAKGLDQQAQLVAAQFDRVRKLPPVLLAVTDLLAQGQLLKAEDLCRQFLRKVPDHVEGMRLLANIGMRFGVLDDAEFLLENAIRFEPDNVPARIDYIQALRKRQKFQKALDQARHLLDTAPDNPQFQSLVAIESMQTGDFETALATFDEVLARLPGDPVTLTSRGHACKTCGDYDAAVSAYRAALASAPQYGEAYYALANLKVYTFSDDEIHNMYAQEANRNLSHIDRVYLRFALGKACEDRQEYDKSFAYYTSGNELKKAQSRYDADTMSAEFDAQRRVCTAEFFEKRAGFGHAMADPVFIVGLPRAGSTLLEQILSSHSQVDGTLELPNILSLSQRLRRQGRLRDAGAYPQVLAELGERELEDFGAEYLRDTAVHRQGAPFFIDKMPNNFRHLGLIKLMLPNAKVIDARRNPMACCFSGFKQLFAEGQDFTYSLEDLGRYYRDYVALMAHWDAVLPGFVLRVQHEDVVANLEREVRRMLDFCGLPFEAGCVEFHRTARNVRTPSSEQVRQPIFRSSLEQWRHFEGHLAPLTKALGPVLDTWDR